MKLTKNKEGKPMQMTKKKVFSAALAVCLIAICSMGTLAWFSAEDAVTNEFMVAGSESGNPEDIFSVDVWEEGDDEKDGLTFEDILPGDTLNKVAHVKNTGSYDEYIRVKITVSDAKIWQDVYKANMVPVTEFVNVDKVDAWSDVYMDDNGNTVHAMLEGDSFVYYLYYKTPLKPDNKETDAVDPDDIVVFNEAYISGHLTKEQAVDLNEDGENGFSIKVTADAVQTENVGDDVYEAFKTVGMEIPLNTTYVKDLAGLEKALKNDGYIVLMNDMFFEADKELMIGKTTNLYLNDYTLSTENDENPNRHDMKVTGDLTVGGYGKILLPDLYGIRLDGTLTVYGGTFVDDADRTNNWQEALFNVYATGKLFIYDGTFEGTDYCVYVREPGAEVNIWGGTFEVSTDKGMPIKYWED